MKRGYADTPEGQIHYYVEGEGEPLLLMHATGSSRQFWKLMPLLAKRFRVYAFDNLGAGGSDPLPPDVAIQDMARSFIHALDALGIEKTHIFGLHTGNKVGTEMAAGWPDRINRLILIGHTHSIMADQQELNDALGHVVASSVRRYEPDAAGGHLLKHWAADFQRLSTTWWDTESLTAKPLTPELLELRKERVIDFLQLRENHEVYRAIFAFDLGERMRQIQAETLIIEVRVPSEAHLPPQGELLVERVPRSRLFTLDNPAGGQAVDVKAEELARVTIEFLTGTGN